MVCQGLVDPCHAIEMPHFVLCVWALPPIDAMEEWFALDSKNGPQGAQGSRDQLVVRLLQRVGIASAPDKRTQQHASFRCAMRPFRREPRSSGDARVLDAW